MTKPDQLSTEEKADKAPRLTPAQAAILASATTVETSLAGQVQPHDEHGNPIEPEPEVDKQAGNRQLLQFLVTAATPALPFLPTCYTPEVIDNIAGAFTAVEEKYGWDVGANIGPEFALAIFALPPTVTAYQLGKAHFAELRAAREAAGKQQAQQQPKPAAQDARTNAIGG